MTDKPDHEKFRKMQAEARKQSAMSKVYEIITDRIIEQLELGNIPWQRSWSGGGLPKNDKQMVVKAAAQAQKTISYPTRYEAFEHPGKLWEQQDTSLRGHSGRELAVYYEPHPNKAYSYLTDGIYAEVCNFQGRHYMVEIHATIPARTRKQKGDTKNFDRYEDAVNWLIEQIPTFQEFINTSNDDEHTKVGSSPAALSSS